MNHLEKYSCGKKKKKKSIHPLHTMNAQGNNIKLGVFYEQQHLQCTKFYMLIFCMKVGFIFETTIEF